MAMNNLVGLAAASAQQKAAQGDGSFVSAQAANNANNMYQRLFNNAASNTAQSDAFAQDLRRWQEEQTSKTMAFNSAVA